MYHRTNNEVKALRRLADKLFDTGEERLAHAALKISRGIMSKTILGSLPSPSILTNLKNLCIDNHINFAVIGGLAVNVHGQARGTEDIDCLVDSFPPVHRLRDSEYMAKFGFYKTKSHTGTILALEARQGNGYVELLLADSDARQWALDGARLQLILRERVPVVSAEALVALKIVAASENKKRQAKDLPDVLSVLLKSKVSIEKVKEHLSKKEIELLETLI